MPDAPVTAPSPEQSIADSKAAYQAFLDTANAEVYEPAATARSNSINNIADAYNQAASSLGNRLASTINQAAGVDSRPRASDGRFVPVTPAPAQAPSAAPATSPAAPAAIPGPPKAAPTQAAPAVQAPAGQLATQAPTPATNPAAAPADPFADVPAADALDQPGSRLTSQNWRRLHAKTDHYVQQVTALQQQVEAAKAAPGSAGVAPKELTDQLNALQAERDSLLGRLEAVAVERSPRFESMFKPRQEAAKTTAIQAAGEHADKVKALIELPDSAYRNSQLNTILRELEPGSLEANKLMMAVASLDQIATERSAMAAKSADLYKQWQSEEQQMQARTMQQRQAAVTTTFEDTVKEWRSAGAAIDDNDLAIARDVFAGNRSLQDIARAAMWVAVGPKAAAQAMALQQQLAAANAELAKLRGIQPGTAPDTGGILTHQDDSAITTPVRQGMYSEGVIQEAMRQGLPWR